MPFETAAPSTSSPFHPLTHDWTQLGAHPEDVVHHNLNLSAHGIAVRARYAQIIVNVIAAAIPVPVVSIDAHTVADTAA